MLTLLPSAVSHLFFLGEWDLFFGGVEEIFSVARIAVCTSNKPDL